MVSDRALRLMGRSLSDSSGSSGYPSIVVLSINARIDAKGPLTRQVATARQRPFVIARSRGGLGVEPLPGNCRG
jgi:hypothetical protein